LRRGAGDAGRYASFKMESSIKLSGSLPMLELDAGHWHRLIPIKFHSSSGLRHHSFGVLFPNWRPWLSHVTPDLQIGIICKHGTRVAVVDETQQPSLYAAILMIGSVDGETVREQRYLTLYSAYESLIPNRDTDATAIRHSLAHPPPALRDPKIVRSLKHRFGAVRVDLRDYNHQKEFYRSLATIICATDQAIASALC
jgi:hypothetical protein